MPKKVLQSLASTGQGSVTFLPQRLPKLPLQISCLEAANFAPPTQTMTTYARKVSLSGQELCAIEVEVEFCLPPKTQKLREVNHELVDWFITSEFLLNQTKKLNEGLCIASTYSGLWKRWEDNE